jgi:hypothetical protein|nr:MAG TPA: upper collar protein [Caudoviricetes sp.]
MNGFSNDFINIMENLSIPNTYWKERSFEYQYWFRSLLHKIDSALIFKNLPSGWNNDFFMLCLWFRGYVAVFPTARKDLEQYGKGVLFSVCTLSGYDFYFQPNKVLINNPMYEATLEIGKQAELLKLTPDYCGIFDILDYYASKLAEISKSIDMGILNAKTPVILTAINESQSETLKKVYDKIQKGESLVIYKNYDNSNEIQTTKDPFEAWTQNLKETYIVTDLLENMQTILNSFYMEIGLPVASEKKERLITSEVEFNNRQSQARISCWYETLSECLKTINKKYNLNIEVDYAGKNDTNRVRESTEL